MLLLRGKRPPVDLKDLFYRFLKLEPAPLLREWKLYSFETSADVDTHVKFVCDTDIGGTSKISFSHVCENDAESTQTRQTGTEQNNNLPPKLLAPSAYLRVKGNVAYSTLPLLGAGEKKSENSDAVSGPGKMRSPLLEGMRDRLLGKEKANNGKPGLHPLQRPGHHPAYTPDHGFAGIITSHAPRTRSLLTLFEAHAHNLNEFSHLCVIIRQPDTTMPLRRLMFNAQANPIFRADMHQYPLVFRDHSWHYFAIPMRSFRSLRAGNPSRRIDPMIRVAVTALGISISKQDGPFAFDVASFSATNPPGVCDEEMRIAMRRARWEDRPDDLAELKRIWHEKDVPADKHN